MTWRSRSRIAVFLLAGLATSAAWAADLTLLCAGALKAPISALLARRDPALPRVVATYATAGAIRERIDGGERPDLVIAPSDALYALMKENLIDIASRRALGTTEVGVAVRADAAVPDIGTADALRATLLAATKVVIVDPARGTSGRLVVAVFKELHIEDAMRDRLLKGDGGYVVEAVARGEADLGLHQISEILPVPGVRLVGPLPGDLRRPTRYDLAMLSGTPRHKEAADLIAGLTSRDAQAVLEKGGFVPPR